MDYKIKNILIGAGALGILMLASAALLYANYYGRSIEPSSFRSFSAAGEGRIVAIPDVAVFTFSVITEGGKDIALLQSQNTDKVNKAIEFVKAKGVETKDIKTQSYNLSPRYQYYSCREILPDDGTNVVGKVCPPAEIVGYTITQTVQVKARDFNKVGDILSGVIAQGANNVSQLSFEIDDQSAIQEQAREQAIMKAKARAEKVASAAGFSIGRLLGIDEGYTPYRVYNTLDYAKTESSSGAQAPVASTVEPGSQEVVVSVTLRYEIK